MTTPSGNPQERGAPTEKQLELQARCDSAILTLCLAAFAGKDGDLREAKRMLNDRIAALVEDARAAAAPESPSPLRQEAGDDRPVARFADESDQPEVQAALRQRDVEQDVEQMVRHDAEEADYRTPPASREASQERGTPGEMPLRDLRDDVEEITHERAEFWMRQAVSDAREFGELADAIRGVWRGKSVGTRQRSALLAVARRLDDFALACRAVSAVQAPASSSGEGGISDEDRHWNDETLWDICREVGRILYPERDGGIYPGPRTAISEIRKIGVELAELRAQTAGPRPSGSAGLVVGTPHKGELMQEEAAALYHELLYAVGNKYPGESRHQTALRYIRQAEMPGGVDSPRCAAGGQSDA